MIEKPFEAPNLKLGRARRHIQEMEDEVTTFIKRDPHVMLLYRDINDNSEGVSIQHREDVEYAAATT